MVYLWPPYEIGQAIICLPCGFFLLPFFFFPRLISVVADWMSTILLHMVWPSANLERRSEMFSVEMQDLKIASGHHRITLLGNIFATKTRIDNRKKAVKQQYLLHMFPQYGELRRLAAEISLVIWGTPANFNGFRVLAVLLHGTLTVGVSQTLQHWTEGATYTRQGGHHVGHWHTVLVFIKITTSKQ